MFIKLNGQTVGFEAFGIGENWAYYKSCGKVYKISIDELKSLEINIETENKSNEEIKCCNNQNVVQESGCETCKNCGWSACKVA